MSDDQPLDVLIAVYLIPDLAQKDFDEYVKLAGDGKIVTDGVALVVKDAEGEVQVRETADHLGRKGVKTGGGVGLVIGLFAPPLLAATRARRRRAGREVRARPREGGHRREDGRRASPRIGRHHRDLRARRRGRCCGRARECDPYLDRTDRQGLRRGLGEAAVGTSHCLRASSIPPTTRSSARRSTA